MEKRGSAKEIARAIVGAYMEREGDFIREHFKGLDDRQARDMAAVMAVLMLKNEITNI